MQQGAERRVFWAILRRFAKKEARAERGTQTESISWRILGLLNIYRLILATAAIVAAATPLLARVLDLQAPYIGTFVAALYLGFGLAAIPALAMKWPALRVQAQLEPLVDIVAAALIVQAIGASVGIFAVLLIPPVGVAGIIAPRLRGAVFFSALAALILLGATLGTQIGRELPVTYFTEAGLFALVVIAVAVVAHALAGELLESQVLAARRAAQVLQLDEINRRIIAEMRTGVVVIDAVGAAVRANPAARRVLGEAGLGDLARIARAEPGRLTQGMELSRGSAVVATTLPLDEVAGGARLVFVEGADVAAEQAQELKLAALGRLTAAVAHQIRNPVSAIAHAGQLLDEDKALSPREQGLVRIIRRQSSRLEGLVSDILSLSRPAPGAARPLALRPWLRDYLTAYRDRQPERATRLLVTPPAADLRVRCDPGHLEHILGNLIDNAFQHGDPARDVELEIRTGEDRVAFDVLDRGPGLPADSERLFEPFATTHASGTGLGLYIARELASANGGRITALDRAGGGACFRLELGRAAERAA